MLGTRTDLKDKIKAGRHKAAGLKRTGPKARIVAAPVDPVPEVDDLEAEELPSEEELAAAAAAAAAAAKIKARITAFVNKGLDKERNRRLRSNEGTMNKRQILACKKALRREGTLKYDPVAAAAAAAVAEAEAMSATESESTDSFEQERAQPFMAPVHATDSCEATHLASNGAPIKFNLGGNRTASTNSSPPRDVATRIRGEHCETSPNRMLQQGQAGSVARGPVETTQYTYVSNGLEQGRRAAAPEDDQWWAAEEAKWKAELDARREGDEVQAAPGPATSSPRNEASGSLEEASGSLEEDICLRTQLILKLPEDQGLGVQLHTPKNEHGVRLTNIMPNGPFGRTQAFEEGDVIVEINGVPLLYAGHAAVFQTIRGEMVDNSQMTVTVCSPAELKKLEALVNNDPAPSAAPTPALSPSPSKGNYKNSSWYRGLIKPFESLSIFSPGSKKSPAAADGKDNGGLMGAPAWWGEGGKRKKSEKAENQAEQKGPPAQASQQAPTTVPMPTAERAYLIYRADIRDLEAYKAEYMSTTSKLIAKFGGRWLARGGKITELEGGSEGDMVLQRMVLIEFPSMQAATDFFHSEEYQDARNMRLSIATAELTVLEGMPPL